uniref:Uncharacterized protein n=1 Tax=Aureimonas altamirensis TaxID=370622 RepID=A0A0P0YXK2_9HYPH|nr:hypothetical protein [Aureimonas altamirensis]
MAVTTWSQRAAKANHSQKIANSYTGTPSRLGRTLYAAAPSAKSCRIRDDFQTKDENDSGPDCIREKRAG